MINWLRFDSTCFICYTRLSILFVFLIISRSGICKDIKMDQTLIDHNSNNRISLFEQKLSIKNAITVSYLYLNGIQEYEIVDQKYNKDEIMTGLSLYLGPYFMDKLGINYKESPDYLFALEILDKKNHRLGSLWAAYFENSHIYVDDILEKAEKYDEFKEEEYKGIKYYSFRLKSRKSCKLYSPIYFYADEKSIVLGDKQDIKSVIDNKAEDNYWHSVKNRDILQQFVINDVHAYRELSSGFISDIDFTKPMELIRSVKYNLVKGQDKELHVHVDLYDRTNEEKADADALDGISNEVVRLKADLLEKIKSIHNVYLDDMVTAITVDQDNASVSVDFPVSNEVCYFFDENLVNNVQEFIAAFPQLLGDESFDVDREYQPKEEDIVENPVIYKDSYRDKDFSSNELKDTYLRGFEMSTALGVKEIAYTDAEKNQLYIRVQLKGMASAALKWMYKYVELEPVSVINNAGETISEQGDCGPYRAGNHVVLGKHNQVTQTVLLKKGVRPEDVMEVNGSAAIKFPSSVRKIILTREDVGKNIELLGQKLKLVSLKDSEFSYYLSGKGDSLIEIRPLNEKGDVLYVRGQDKRSNTFPDGFNKLRMTHYVEGKIDSLELYSVDHFMTSSHGYGLKADVRKDEESKAINLPNIEAFTYADIRGKYYDSESGSWQSPPVDSFYKKDLEKWNGADAGPFRIYLKDDHGSSEINARFYVLAPVLSIFDQSMSTMEIIIDDVETRDGQHLSRPSDEEILEQEKDRRVSYNGNTKINWNIHVKLHNDGETNSANEVALLGIKKRGEEFKHLNARAIIHIPESLTEIEKDTLNVGDGFKQQGVDYEVTKYVEGNYYLSLNNGAEKLVNIRAKRDNTYVELELKRERNNIVKIPVLGPGEKYEFIIANKVHTEEIKMHF